VSSRPYAPGGADFHASPPCIVGANRHNYSETAPMAHLLAPFMRDPGFGLRGTVLPRTPVNSLVVRDRLGPKDARGYTPTRVKG
jgi:hypothetical protein